MTTIAMLSRWSGRHTWVAKSWKWLSRYRRRCDGCLEIVCEDTWVSRWSWPSIGRRSRFSKLFVMFIVTSVDLTFLSNSKFYEIFDVFRTFKPDAKIFQKIWSLETDWVALGKRLGKRSALKEDVFEKARITDSICTFNHFFPMSGSNLQVSFSLRNQVF